MRMNLKKLGTKTTRSNAITYGIVILAFIFVQILDITGILTSSLRGQLVPISAYVVMAISLNLTVGILGELSLGHAGFMSLGAFSGVVLSISLQEQVASEPLRLLAAILIGAVIAGIFGFIV